jgi:hypothetical protein
MRLLRHAEGTTVSGTARAAATRLLTMTSRPPFHGPKIGTEMSDAAFGPAVRVVNFGHIFLGRTQRRSAVECHDRGCSNSLVQEFRI